jgi:hypothetical protein
MHNIPWHMGKRDRWDERIFSLGKISWGDLLVHLICSICSICPIFSLSREEKEGKRKKL